MPRHSSRTSRLPQRFGDYVMQQTVHTGVPIPAPRHKTITHTQKHTPIPTPRHRKESMLGTLLGIQEEQCKFQGEILSLLKQT